MTTVTFVRQGDAIVSFECRGHAGDAPEGENVLCAAVSALTQTAVLGVTEALGQKAEWLVDEENAVVSLKPRDPMDRGVQAILQTLYVGMKNIADQFPKDIRIIDGKRR